MTSTTSSLNGSRQFSQIYLWSLRKNIGMAALHALLLFLVNPLILLISLSGQKSSMELDSHLTAAEKAERFSEYYSSFVDHMAPFLAMFVVLVFCAVLCVNLFSYLQNKRSVDLLHALPVRRESMLLGRWFAGITVLFVPVLLDCLSMWIISAAYGIPAAASMQTLFLQMLWVLLMGAAAFTFCVFMMLCTGTTLDAVLSALGINGGYPLLIICVYTVAGLLLPGFNGEDVFQHLGILTAFAPFAAGIFATIDGQSVWLALWWLAVTLLLLAGSILLYRRRRSETAEDNFAIPLPKIAVRFLLTAAGGLGFGLILNTSSMSGFFFGVLFGSFATHVVVEAVYSRGFRYMKKSMMWYGIFVVMFIACYGVLCTGLFGYDTRVPNASEVESVSVIPYYSGDHSTQIVDDHWNQIAELTPTIRDSENIKTVVNLQQNIIQKYRSRYPYRLKNHMGGGLTFSYKLKNGKVMTRVYQSYSDDMDLNEMVQPFYKELSGMREYVETSDLIFYVQPDSMESIDVYTAQAQGKTHVLDAEKAQQLQEAVKQDLYDKEVNGNDLSDQKAATDRYLSISVDYRENFVPEGEKLKALLGGYQGRINIQNANYVWNDDSSATWNLLAQWGWL
ncbi:MAG: hypothetical protein LKJ17_06150 [Oscillospiraceae bacterium]|jgi:hypothetical protein|nr:hypothetical protein [Oscillospiraceae bacterium]